MDDEVRLWLVERTFSDDEQNVVILVYATTDGRRYHRKERALPSFSGTHRDTTASVTQPGDQLGEVTDPDRRRRYAREATRMATTHQPTDPV